MSSRGLAPSLTTTDARDQWGPFVLTSGRTVPSDEPITTDVCIIGAGLAGITIAKRLVDSKVDAVLLERGDEMGTGAGEDLGNALSVGIPYPVDKARGTGIGGALHKWHVTTPLGDGFGRLREFAPDDFSERPWVPNSGWPFSKSELAPYYRDAREWFDTPWPSPDPEPVWDEEFATSILCDSHNDPVRSEVFAFANPGVFAADYRRQLEHSEDALVLTHSAAVALQTGREYTAVRSVEVATSEGRFRILPRVIVLAAGGIENSRLLLVSREHHRHGIGNAHDLVGRYFMEHPRFTSGIIYPNEALRETDTVWDIHMHQGVPVQRKLRFSPEVCEREELPNSIYFLRRGHWSRALRAARHSTRHYRAVAGVQRLRKSMTEGARPHSLNRRLRDIVAGPDAILRSVLADAKQLQDAVPASEDTEPAPLTIEVMAEQVPNPASRVTLHEERDEFGVPKAALDWQLTDFDLRTALRGQELLADHLEARGAGEVRTLLRPGQLPDWLHSAKHHMGTTRMDPDPRRGVVDADCVVHGTGNLYVAGPSVLPTGGDANPTLTTVAMALRLSDRLLTDLPSS